MTESLTYYATKVPNLAFAPTGDGIGTSRTVSIRGIAGDNVTGLYIDDTPLPDSLDPRVLDVDHIEVLRGPQGTLYGARSMGGTVRIITKEPNLHDFDASVHGGVSSTDHTSKPSWTGDGVLNLPGGRARHEDHRSRVSRIILNHRSAEVRRGPATAAAW